MKTSLLFRLAAITNRSRAAGLFTQNLRRGLLVAAGVMLLLSSSVARANIILNNGTFAVNGPVAFSKLENTGVLVETWSINDIITTTINSITAVASGPSSDSDDLMLLTSPAGLSAGNPAHPPLTFPITLNSASGSHDLLPFALTFNPVDTSGVNDYDSGTTPFLITITYDTTQTAKFTVMGTTLDPPKTPEPSSLYLFGSGIVALAGVMRRKLRRG